MSEKLDYSKISLLLHIEEKLREQPKLRAIYDLAWLELIDDAKAAEQLKEELAKRAKAAAEEKAKADAKAKEEADAKASEAPAPRAFSTHEQRI